MSIPIPDWYRADAIKRYALRPNEQAVYDCLCYHAHGRTRIAWPSQITIAKERKLNPRTVKRAMARLAEVGLIIQRDEGRPGRSARWMIADMHPRGRSTTPSPTVRAVWDEATNGLVGVEMAMADVTSTSASGPEVAPQIDPNPTPGTTGLNSPTSALGPPEGKGTSRTHVATSSADAENVHRSAADERANDDDEEDHPETGSRSSMDKSKAIDRSSAAQRATFSPKALPPTGEQERALADLAWMIGVVGLTVADRDEAAEVIRGLRREQHYRIWADTPFDCTLDVLSAGTQRYFRDRDLDHLFG